jgi:hypothetical protein
MRRLFCILPLLVALLAAGCANKYATPLPPGATEEEVIARHGHPTARYQDGNTTLLEYASGYWAQYAFFATMDANGRLVKWEQVLTDEKFNTLEVGKATRADLLKTIGHPAEITRIHKYNYEVWTYRYKRAFSWDFVMHFMFDPNDPGSTVKMKESGIDLMYDPGGD